MNKVVDALNWCKWNFEAVLMLAVIIMIIAMAVIVCFLTVLACIFIVKGIKDALEE